jgi:hypothetical protein
MKKDTVWLVVAILLLLGVVGGLVWIFGGFGGGDDMEVPDTQQEISDTENQDETDEEDTVVEPTEEDEEEETDGNPNTAEETEVDDGDAQIDTSATYSNSAQSVGEETEELFTLSDIEVNKGSEVLEIEFVLTGDELTEDSTLVTSVVNKGSLGAMEIVLSSIESDGTGMGFDESIAINKDGITRLTKVVSGVQNILKYNLGFTDSLDYYLYEPELSGSNLIVKLSIKYPGGEISTEEFGTTEFTSEDITVESNTAENGVRISGYTYSVSGGVLRYILKTSTNTGSPIPSFEGSLDEGVLTVTFPSLNADITYSATGGEVSLPSGVTLNISRSSEQSVYEFVGVGTEYRIYGETSPNQVIIEVKI